MLGKWQDLGVAPADILLPAEGIDLYAYSVVACDQFTSDHAYWEQVKALVGDKPSTFNLIYPEIYLNQNTDEYINRINTTMEEYLKKGLFEEFKQAIFYVERTQSNGKVRKGLVLGVDLEAYDYKKGSKSLIRATEGTIEDRLPPRIKIRKHAKLELPHIMLLADDPENTIFSPVEALAQKGGLKPLYETPLMQNGGSIKAWLLDENTQQNVLQAVTNLGSKQRFAKKYNVEETEPLLLFAVGDGNHSLATAKVCYERLKAQIGARQAAIHPARYALAELVNLHDHALEFEPIHRVIFNVDEEHFINELKNQLNLNGSGEQCFTLVQGGKETKMAINNPTHNLTVGTLQGFLDEYLKTHPQAHIDYIHEAQTVYQLAQQKGNIGFILPAMDKNDLFLTVIKDGVLPRKTFSMGNGNDKRYYMEARVIR